MCNKEKADIMLAEFTKQIKAHFGEKLSEVILFGSYARETYDSESDIVFKYYCTKGF